MTLCVNVVRVYVRVNVVRVYTRVKYGSCICECEMCFVCMCHNPLDLRVYNGYKRIRCDIIVRATTKLL